jgi:uncharacterized lipoprotein YmbA
VIEVPPVRVPDYLDTTDLLVREGNQLVPSKTGRWAERLSVGVTRDLAASLAARLPNVSVTTAAPVEPPLRQVLVDVTNFETSANREIVLVARWTITDGAGRATLVSERTALVEPLASMNDSVVVAAMSHQVEELADRIAAAVQHSLERHPTERRRVRRR